MSVRRLSKPEIARRIQQAVAYQQTGRPDLAVQIYQEIYPLVVRDASVLRLYAIALVGAGKPKQAFTTIDKAIKLEPMNPQLRVDRARLLTDLGRYPEAVIETDRALAQQKGFSQAIHARVVAMRRMGESREAYEWLLAATDENSEDSWVIDSYAELASEVDDLGPILGALQRALVNENELTSRVSLNYKIGDVLHRLKRYDEAFEAYDQANELRRTPFDTELHTKHTRELMESWKAGPPSIEANANLQPIFVTGVPRSGTSLVEQILSAHSNVAAAGETVAVAKAAQKLGVAMKPYGYVFGLEGQDESQLADMGEMVVKGIEKLAGAQGEQRVTDKMPENIMQVGFLASLFPRAKFIHCIRDIRDVCLSCYRQEFSGFLPYTRDLTACAHYAADVAEIGQFWHELLPDQVYPLHYSELVLNAESEIPALLDFVELPMEEDCLRHHESDRTVRTASFEQATQPIYTDAIARWRPYEKHLQPVVDVMRERGIGLN